jgi:hypothetical protein
VGSLKTFKKAQKSNFDYDDVSYPSNTFRHNSQLSTSCILNENMSI